MTNTYTIRRPGCSAWAENVPEAEAIEELRRARDAFAPSMVLLVRDEDGVLCHVEDGAIVVDEALTKAWDECSCGDVDCWACGS